MAVLIRDASDIHRSLTNTDQSQDVSIGTTDEVEGTEDDSYLWFILPSQSNEVFELLSPSRGVDLASRHPVRKVTFSSRGCRLDSSAMNSSVVLSGICLSPATSLSQVRGTTSKTPLTLYVRMYVRTHERSQRGHLE